MLTPRAVHTPIHAQEPSMPEQEKPIRTFQTNEVIEKSEDLSQINSLLHRIQATAGSDQPPKTGNNETPTNQTGK